MDRKEFQEVNQRLSVLGWIRDDLTQLLHFTFGEPGPLDNLAGVRYTRWT